MKTYKKLLLIVNPNAGIKRKENSLSDIVLTFAEYDYETIVCFTKRRGHATKLVEQHANEDIALIVCMGGDGTLNETFAGAIKIKWNKPIGYIPAGSTNDFACSLGLPGDAVKAAQRVMTGKPRNLDLGQFNGRTFVYTACSGLFSKTSYETPQEIKNRIGHLAYILEGVKDFSQFKPVYMEIKVDKEVYKDNYIFVGICNTFSIGGIMTLDENSIDLNDGYFELLTISLPRDLQQFNMILKALTEQNYEDNPFVMFKKIKKAEIVFPHPDDWSLDGEKQDGKEKIRFEVIKDAVQLIY